VCGGHSHDQVQVLAGLNDLPKDSYLIGFACTCLAQQYQDYASTKRPDQHVPATLPTQLSALDYQSQAASLAAQTLWAYDSARHSGHTSS